MALITYTDKETMNENAEIPAINKCQAADMNEIKSVVNENYNEYSTFINGTMGDYVIESGVNYLKFNSGILIQWGTINVTAALNIQMSNVYRTQNPQRGVFTIPFVNATYNVVCTPISAINSYYIVERKTTEFNGYPISYSSTAGASRWVLWLAIGRWK